MIQAAVRRGASGRLVSSALLPNKRVTHWVARPLVDVGAIPHGARLVDDLMRQFLVGIEFTRTCWLRKTAKPDYYGRAPMSVSRVLGERQAHRVSWILFHGPIPEGLWVLHHCDIRACVRPDHLFLGTDRDNKADMVAKKRAFSPHGERNGGHKVTTKQVVEIRSRFASGETCKELLAKEYGVTSFAIRAILAGKVWKHLLPPSGGIAMWGIWDFETNDWIREMPSKVDDGGTAVLAFMNKREACRRATKHFACDTYRQAQRRGWCEVMLLPATTGEQPSSASSGN